MVIRVFEGDQASSENSGHSGRGPPGLQQEPCGPCTGVGVRGRPADMARLGLSPRPITGLLNSVPFSSTWSWAPRGLASPPPSHQRLWGRALGLARRGAFVKHTQGCSLHSYQVPVG